MEIAARLLEAVAAPVELQGVPVSATLSLGMTLFPEVDEGPDQLLRHADAALYRSKQGGRNRLTVHASTAGEAASA